MLRSGSPSEPSSADAAAKLQAAGEAFARAGVAALYLVHGTFAGGDALGLFNEAARFAPRAAAWFEQLSKQAVDLLLGETGNFTARYAARLEAALSAGAGRPLPVRRFAWTGMNNHIGRANAAIKLIEELAAVDSSVASEPRVLFWAHSHGGNILALVTNLLGADPAGRDEFFAAARIFYRQPWSEAVDFPAWQRVEQRLADPADPLRRLRLDVVTLGTPIRYGWDSHGYSKLLHIIEHCPSQRRPEYLTDYPPPLWSIFTGRGGDFVHQIGIAGSNLPPFPLALRTFVADRELGRLLQQRLPGQFLCGRLRHGMRVADEGTTLLVDYDDPDRFPLRHLLGHAVYTRSRWMALHGELMAREFYDAETNQARGES